MSTNIDLDDLLKLIREKLIFYRNRSGKSVYQLGLDSGVDNSVIFRIEKGERAPHLSTLLKMLSALDVTPNEFFGEFDQTILLGK